MIGADPEVLAKTGLVDLMIGDARRVAEELQGLIDRLEVGRSAYLGQNV